jgi:hypothetical protein
LCPHFLFFYGGQNYLRPFFCELDPLFDFVFFLIILQFFIFML